jgi:hypothetical protein
MHAEAATGREETNNATSNTYVNVRFNFFIKSDIYIYIYIILKSNQQQSLCVIFLKKVPIFFPNQLSSV